MDAYLCINCARIFYKIHYSLKSKKIPQKHFSMANNRGILHTITQTHWTAVSQWQPPTDLERKSVSERVEKTIVKSGQTSVIMYGWLQLMQVNEWILFWALLSTFSFITCVGFNTKIYEQPISQQEEEFFKKVFHILGSQSSDKYSEIWILCVEQFMKWELYMPEVLSRISHARDIFLDTQEVQKLPVWLWDVISKIKSQVFWAVHESIFPFTNLVQTLYHLESLWVTLHDRSAILQIVSNPSRWMWESYMQQKWEHPNLFELYKQLLSWWGHASVSSKIANCIYKVRWCVSNLQSRNRSTQVIQEHYDIPSQVYEQFLDPYMQYTCWLFASGNIDDNEGYKKVDMAMSLEQAQIAKMERICQKLDIKPGDRVLDMGGGWWWLAKYMIETRGVKVDVVTLSGSQADYIEEKMCRWFDVRVHRCDYRDMWEVLQVQQFDTITCVGMLEHIGHKNIDEFFRIISTVLKPWGRWLMHCIFSPRNTYMRDPFVEKYIFPGWEIIPWKTIWEKLSRYFDLELNREWGIEDWSQHYVQTLLHWAERFSHISGLPESEKRKTAIYLNSMAAGFATRRMWVGQRTFGKSG